jgi:hypothetical protein
MSPPVDSTLDGSECYRLTPDAMCFTAIQVQGDLASAGVRGDLEVLLEGRRRCGDHECWLRMLVAFRYRALSGEHRD